MALALHAFAEFPFADSLKSAVDPVNGGGDWICTKPDHWIFAGTGMKKGDRIPGLVGWEYHGDPPADIPGLEIVTSSSSQGSTNFTLQFNLDKSIDALNARPRMLIGFIERSS